MRDLRWKGGGGRQASGCVKEVIGGYAGIIVMAAEFALLDGSLNYHKLRALESPLEHKLAIQLVGLDLGSLLYGMWYYYL
jgi:hypothetical protein